MAFPTAALLSGFGALVLFQFLKTIYYGFKGPLASVPGPWYTRFTTLPFIWHRMSGNSIVHADKLFRQYGPIVRIQPNLVMIADDKAWDEVLRMGTNFRKADFHGRMRVGPDKILFAITDVKQHASRRKLFARALTMDSLRKHWEDQVRVKVDAAVERIRTDATGGGVADLFKWWRLMAADVIALLSFGESFNMIETAGEGEREYFDALLNAGLNIVIRDVLPFLPVMARLLPWKKLHDIINADHIVTEKGTVAVRNLRNTGLDQPNLFTNMLAEAEKAQSGEKEGSELTDDAVRSEVAGFLLAGSDTTGFAMTMIVWAVLRRPELQRRLEEEVAGLPANFTDKEVERLTLLNNVIDEAMRLYNPAGAGVLRKVPPEGATFFGHYIPGGISVQVQHYSMCRDPNLFPDPDRFDETRFQHATERQRHIAQPYGYGSRSCVGISLAKMELRLATATFFRKCRGAKLSKDVTDEMMEIRSNFFPYPRGRKCEITLSS